MKRISLLLAVLLGFVNVQGQNFEKEMELAYKNFVLPEYISFNILYVLRADPSPESRMISESKGRYIKYKSSYLSVLDSKSTLVTPKEIVMIDDEYKRMRVKKLKTPLDNTVDFMEQLKEFNKNIVRTESNAIESNRIVYHVFLANTDLLPIRQYDICLNLQTHLIERLTLFYKKPLEKDDNYKIYGNEVPRLDITFSAIETGKPFAVKDLNPGNYYLKTESHLSPTNKFKGYEIKEVY